MAERGPRHRFELTRLEIGGVIVSAAATLFVVFLLGVYAGRGMEAGAGTSAQQLVRLPVASATDDSAEDKWTFDETSPEAKTAAAPQPAAVATQHPAAVAAAGSPRDGADGGLRGAAASRDDAHGHAETVTHGAQPSHDDGVEPRDTEASGSATAARPAGAKEAVAKEAGAADKKLAHPAAAAPTPRPRIAVALVSAVSTPQARAGGEWSVQVTATKDPRAADAMVQRLKARGYQAYVQRVQRNEGTLYRVRVGKYPSLDNANQIVTRLRHEPGVPEAFVASD